MDVFVETFYLRVCICLLRNNRALTASADASTGYGAPAADPSSQFLYVPLQRDEFVS